MAWFDFFWYDENRDHIAQHGVTPEEFEYVVCHPTNSRKSASMSKPTPTNAEDLKQRWRRAVKSAEADRPAVVERDKRLWRALDEQTLSGELRRAMFDSPLSTGEISERSNVPLAELDGFLYGETPLDSEAFSRIAQVLDCHLVASR